MPSGDTQSTFTGSLENVENSFSGQLKATYRSIEKACSESVISASKTYLPMASRLPLFTNFSEETGAAHESRTAARTAITAM